MSLFAQIQKPTLLLDTAATKRNINRLSQKALQYGVHFRPHFKTHQSAEIGAWFRPAGVNAITVSSLDMAQYFYQNGWDDITLAFPVNLRQIDAINSLATRIRLGLLVESEETIRYLTERLAVPVDVWIKVDTGNGRTGIAWDNPVTLSKLASQIHAGKPLRFQGLLTHAGQTYRAHTPAEICQVYEESVQRINQARDALAGLGEKAALVSVGDTPAASLCPPGRVDELRPGNFVFFDAQQLQLGSCRVEDVSIAVACPVVACHPERNELVVYGGAIHLSNDFLVEDGRRVYGYVALPEGERWGAPLPGAYVRGLSQEHGIVHLEAQDLEGIHPGDLICILPAHSCLTVTAMKKFLTLDGKVITTMNQ